MTPRESAHINGNGGPAASALVICHGKHAGEPGPCKPPPNGAAQDDSLAGFKEKLGLSHIVGEHHRLAEILRKLPAIARSNATVLIVGETGTGKEVCARAIHDLSPQRKGLFSPLDCGAVPASLIENELFGHRAGAYTGANHSAPGLLKETDGGTLFLDEIDSMPGAVQVKLLRFLQQREFRSLGSARLIKADVRVIAATNADLEEAIRSGRFRKDLYYRLNVVPILLPPLRERTSDIPLLARHFLAKHASSSCPRSLSPRAITKLLAYEWPGNIRELENIIERALIFTEGPTIHAEDLHMPGLPADTAPQSFKALKAKAVAQFERNYLLELLRNCNGNVAHAARAAQKNRRALWELMRKHRLGSLSARPLASPGDLAPAAGEPSHLPRIRERR